ncbi:efflux RND transporter periplasmic adaptor subunit [Sulfurovum sp. XGS-02]|uniref:efflux RND transporter periplasmic adaptor subunit n=1 Tax=Sulfurovum sp. XGS-02 TaxID=2925411 RepID=UPI00205206AE|nr:efflux RND transporter periplasmic adaptor subunit [Sulfurovum sp. XGS-02]UPT77491.1 efflux RND transporter periplasmic adaptor subunit [Sulfurovum sp. XGS-02]
MTKYLLLLLPLLSFASAIKVEHAQLKPLGKMIQTNAQITQLSDQKQEIVSRLSGHLERYYVQAGQHVKNGEKVALIESIELSKMSAAYLALIQQSKAAEIQKNATMKLHQKGLSSQNDLSNAIISLEEIRSKKNALASQLKSLGINPTTLKEATDKLTIYAHADGVVGQITAPLHSNVDAQTLLMTLVNQSGYYAVAYLGVNDAMKITKETKGWINVAEKQYPSTFVQLLPNIDPETQRAKVLFSIDQSPSNLLLGAFNEMDIALAPYTNTVMVKKSALSLFKGEWVVFVEKEHEEAEHHDEKPDHDHDKEDKEHEEHEDSDDEEGEEHEEAPYEAKVVEIVAYAGDDVAVKGLKADEEYVSEGVYFVKSMILKSSLGDGD